MKAKAFIKVFHLLRSKALISKMIRYYIIYLRKLCHQGIRYGINSPLKIHEKL